MAQATAYMAQSPSSSLEIWATTFEILRTMWRGKWLWARASLGAFLMYAAIVAVALALTPADVLQHAEERPPLLRIVGLLAGFAYVPAATMWLRYLIRSAPPPTGIQYRWGREETIYLVRMLQFLLAVIAISVVGMMVIVIGNDAVGGNREWGTGAVGLAAGAFLLAVTFALIGCGVWYAVTFMMIFPAAANGDDSSFRASAELVRGHRWNLIFITLISTFCGWFVALVVLLAVFALQVSAIFALLRLGGATGDAGPLEAGFTVLSYLNAFSELAIGVWFITLMHTTVLGCLYRRLAVFRSKGLSGLAASE